MLHVVSCLVVLGILRITRTYFTHHTCTGMYTAHARAYAYAVLSEAAADAAAQVERRKPTARVARSLFLSRADSIRSIM